MGTRKKCPNCGAITRTRSLKNCKKCNFKFPRRTTALAVTKNGGLKMKLLKLIGLILILTIAISLFGCKTTEETSAVTTTGTTATKTASTTVANTTATTAGTIATTAATTTATTAAPTTAAPTTVSTTALAVHIPTDGEMQIAFGFDKVGIKPVFTGNDIPWEPAKWQLQWVDSKPLSLLLLKDWEFTVTREDNIVAVYYGDGVTTINIKGASMRYLPAYNTVDSIWAQDPQEMLKREDAFGMSRDPKYHTIAGNLSIPDPKPTPATTSSSITKTWLSTNIGGASTKWTAPTEKGGYWVFKDKGHPVSLKFPGKGSLDVWIGKAVSITSDNKNLLLGKTFDEASYLP